MDGWLGSCKWHMLLLLPQGNHVNADTSQYTMKFLLLECTASMLKTHQWSLWQLKYYILYIINLWVEKFQIFIMADSWWGLSNILWVKWLSKMWCPLLRRKLQESQVWDHTSFTSANYSSLVRLFHTKIWWGNGIWDTKFCFHTKWYESHRNPCNTRLQAVVRQRQWEEW